MLSRKKILRSDNHELPDKPTLRSLSIDPMGDYPSKYDLGFRVRPQGHPRTLVDPDNLLTLPKKTQLKVQLFVCLFVGSNVSLGLILRKKCQISQLNQQNNNNNQEMRVKFNLRKQKNQTSKVNNQQTLSLNFLVS